MHNALFVSAGSGTARSGLRAIPIFAKRGLDAVAVLIQATAESGIKPGAIGRIEPKCVVLQRTGQHPRLAFGRTTAGFSEVSFRSGMRGSSSSFMLPSPPLEGLCCHECLYS
jgi:hypothetical protein